jgi:HSP20 family protein
MRFDPYREMDRFAQMLTQQTGPAHQAAMPMDAYRDGYRFIVNFDLPGVDPASLDLTVEKNVLTVRAERTWQPEEGQEVVIAERPQGTFTRQLLMGENLDAEHVQASYDQGVLTLMIPVAEQAKPHKVAVAVISGTGEAIETGIGPASMS